MCDEMRMFELLSLQIDEMITLEEQAELELHLAACPECRVLAQEMAQMHKAMPKEEAVPLGFHQKVMDQVHAEKVIPFVPKNKSRTHWKTWMASAAVLALVVGGSGVMKNFLTGNVPGGGVAIVMTRDAMPTETAQLAEQPVAELSREGDMGENAPVAFGARAAAEPHMMALDRLLEHLDWQVVSSPIQDVVEDDHGNRLTYMGGTEDGKTFGFLMENQDGETLGQYLVPECEGDIVLDLSVDFGTFTK